MATISDHIREFLATGPLAHVVSLDPDGTPYVTLGWAGVDGDQVVLATFPDQHKLHNLRRDPRITLSFQAIDFEGPGLHPYLVLRGTARVIEGGALEVMDRLAEVYIGPGQKFWMRDVPPGFVIHVTVEKAYGIGSWRDPSAS